MKIRKQTLKAGITGVIIGVILSLSSISMADMDATDRQQENLPITEVQRFTNAIEQIKSHYINSVSDKELFENAMHGMLTGLDPHSSYLDESELNTLTSVTTGQFSGIGLEITMENGILKVITPLDGSPAEKAGIKPGDIIVSINNTTVENLSLIEAVNKMRGPKGTAVNLLIYREGEKTPLKISVTRDNIVVKSIKYSLLDSKYAYVRLATFQTDTANDLNDAITKLRTQAGGKLYGLILDLRNNPGGLLDSAVSVSDAFLDNSKVIVSTKGRTPNSTLEESATPGDILQGAPIVVLINGGSASAAEIVAGALQDEKRAVIMGEQSFGKGSVQTVIPLDEKTAIKLTTALYYTPSGKSIQAHGITPDVVVKPLDLSKAKAAQDPNEGIKESNLPGHLQNDNEATKINPIVEAKRDSNLENDYQVTEALQLLKGLAIRAQN